MNPMDVDHLMFLSETVAGRSHLKEALHVPGSCLWRGSSPGRLSALLDRFASLGRDDHSLLSMLQLNLFTETLLQKGDAPEWFRGWVEEHVPIDRYLPNLSWSIVDSGHWHAVPVFLFRDRVYLRYLVLGCVYLPKGPPLWPKWAERMVDESTKTGVLSAEEACRKLHPKRDHERFICYPLTHPNQKLQFQQASLGLPAALGFMALLNNESLSADLASSGVVSEDGCIHKVGRLSQKAAHAGNMGFNVLLYPATHRPPLSGEDMELVPVDDLSEAWMFARLYASDRTGSLLLMRKMLKDPQVFVDNCNSVPVKWLSWDRKHPLRQPVKKSISISPGLFENLVKKIAACLDCGDLIRGETLAGYIDDDALETILNDSPHAAFKWFMLNLSMANHRGDVQAAFRWQKEAEQLVQATPISDTHFFADFYNHWFIGLHHNRYHFDPELPTFVRDILTALEGEYRIQRQLVPEATHETLGALYGSIAQNYGFCGPAFLPKTEHYCRLYEKAFGQGKVSHLKEHALRSHNYLTYAYLDAKAWDLAEEALMTYLGIEAWQDLSAGLPDFSQWQHAALARFFAGCGRKEERQTYLKWALENKPLLIEERHPWQLWLNNMGRVCYALGEIDKSTKFFDESLKICSSQRLGPTVRVMGLMPLSGLWRTGHMKSVDVDGVAKSIKKAAADLDPAYFSTLLNGNELAGVLETVWRRPETLFPFTYR